MFFVKVSFHYMIIVEGLFIRIKFIQLNCSQTCLGNKKSKSIWYTLTYSPSFGPLHRNYLLLFRTMGPHCSPIRIIIMLLLICNCSQYSVTEEETTPRTNNEGEIVGIET